MGETQQFGNVSHTNGCRILENPTNKVANTSLCQAVLIAIPRCIVQTKLLQHISDCFLQMKEHPGGAAEALKGFSMIDKTLQWTGNGAFRRVLASIVVTLPAAAPRMEDLEPLEIGATVVVTTTGAKGRVVGYARVRDRWLVELEEDDTHKQRRFRRDHLTPLVDGKDAEKTTEEQKNNESTTMTTANLLDLWVAGHPALRLAENWNEPCGKAALHMWSAGTWLTPEQDDACGVEEKNQDPDTTADTTASVKKSEAEWKNSLTDVEYHVLRKKGTEKGGTGALNKFYPKPGEGHFACRGCSSPLYSVQAKFDSGCGWPAFDKCYANSVRTEVDDSLGVHRVEIVCNACDGHLGHVFEGEKFTATNERHCVNSISLKFVKGCQPDNVKEEALCSKLK